VKTRTVSVRFSFFEDVVKNKTLLHFGCNDCPIFNPSYNLHIKLAKYASKIDGFDIDLEGIENLKKYVNQDYYSNFDQLVGK
jgi:hypothetical protein